MAREYGIMLPDAAPASGAKYMITHNAPYINKS